MASTRSPTSDLSLSAQAKLLRAIQDLAVERVGATGHHRVDIRVVAATNRSLASLVERRLFRADLYYRLSGVDLRIPARELAHQLLPTRRQVLRLRRSRIRSLSHRRFHIREQLRPIPAHPLLQLGRPQRLPLFHSRFQGTISIVGGLAIWEFLSRVVVNNALFLAAPTQIIAAIFKLAATGELEHHMAISGLKCAFALDSAAAASAE